MNYLLNWLQIHFRVISFRNNEALIVCPSCGREKLYFNVSKKVGYCHYCRKTVTVKNLTDICGFAPNEQLLPSFEVTSKRPVSPPTSVSLPEHTIPLVTRVNNEYLTNFPIALRMVVERGVSVENIYRYNFHFDGLRIYIPVYCEGQMVSWIGRAAWWFEHGSGKKYMYADGTEISRFLFDWDNAQNWNRLALCENTFNGIRYQNSFNCTSNFGSNLSKTQINLILRSSSKCVILLWDEGTSTKAEKVVYELRNRGIPAAFAVISGQPDNYEDHDIREIAECTFNAAMTGKVFYP